MTRSLVSVEPSELDDAGRATEVEVAVIRDEDPDREGILLLSPAELAELYARLKLYYEHGTWSQKTVQW